MKRFIARHDQIGQPYDDLIIVSGAQQGIELSAKVLLDDGDTLI